MPLNHVGATSWPPVSACHRGRCGDARGARRPRALCHTWVPSPGRPGQADATAADSAVFELLNYRNERNQHAERQATPHSPAPGQHPGAVLVQLSRNFLFTPKHPHRGVGLALKLRVCPRNPSQTSSRRGMFTPVTSVVTMFCCV